MRVLAQATVLGVLGYVCCQVWFAASGSVGPVTMDHSTEAPARSLEEFSHGGSPDMRPESPSVGRRDEPFTEEVTGLDEVPTELADLVESYGRDDWVRRRFGSVRTIAAGLSFRDSLDSGDHLPVILESRSSVTRRLASGARDMPAVIRDGMYHCMAIRINDAFETSFGQQHPGSRPVLVSPILGRHRGLSEEARLEVTAFCDDFNRRMEAMRSEVWTVIRSAFVEVRGRESRIVAMHTTGTGADIELRLFREGEDDVLDSLLRTVENLDDDTARIVSKAFDR